MALLDCSINEKLVKVLMEDRALTLFFRSHPGGFDSSSRSNRHREFAIQGKKILFGGQPRVGGWAQLELTDAYENE